MKYQGENKNRNNKFDPHDFIHFAVDLIGPFSTFQILLSNIYIHIHKYSIYIYKTLKPFD